LIAGYFRENEGIYSGQVHLQDVEDKRYYVVQEKGEYNLEEWLESNEPTEVEVMGLIMMLGSLAAFFHGDDVKASDVYTAPCCFTDLPLSNIVWFKKYSRWKVVERSSLPHLNLNLNLDLDFNLNLDFYGRWLTSAPLSMHKWHRALIIHPDVLRSRPD